jgi:thymidylate synthase
LEQANLQVARKPLPLPALHLNQSIMHINDFTYEDIEVRDYEHHPHIAAPISV